jgi:hypothetical protein
MTPDRGLQYWVLPENKSRNSPHYRSLTWKVFDANEAVRVGYHV